MRTELTLSDVEYLIDKHMEDETNFLFVCDFTLAKHICDYLEDNYSIVDEESDLESKADEFYISIWFDEFETDFFCETARTVKGEYKQIEVANVDVNYYIFTSMSKSDILENFTMDGAVEWCDLVSQEPQYSLSDEQEEELNLLIQATEDILNTGGNPEKIFNFILGIYFKGKSIGFTNAKDSLREMVEKM